MGDESGRTSVNLLALGVRQMMVGKVVPHIVAEAKLSRLLMPVRPLVPPL